MSEKEVVIIREARIKDALKIINFLKIVTKETNNLLLTPINALDIELKEEEEILKNHWKVQIVYF